MTEEPLIYWYSFNYTQNIGSVSNIQTRDISKYVRAANKEESAVGLTPELPFKFIVFAMDKNSLIIRFENIGDKFDKDNEDLLIDVRAIAMDIFLRANG